MPKRFSILHILTWPAWVLVLIIVTPFLLFNSSVLFYQNAIHGSNGSGREIGLEISKSILIIIIMVYLIVWYWSLSATYILPKKLNLLTSFSNNWLVILCTHFFAYVAILPALALHTELKSHQYFWLLSLLFSLTIMCTLIGVYRLFQLITQANQEINKWFVLLAIFFWPVGIWWLQPKLKALWMSDRNYSVEDHFIH